MKKLLLAILILSFTVPAFAQKVLVIVNSSNNINQITKDQLQDFFFKKNRVWSDGSPVRFFDHVDSEIRKLFLRNYIRKTSRQVDQFWIGQKFNTGDSAPTQVSSDAMVINLVARFPGGIGYVKEGAPISRNVKIIDVTEL